MKAGPIEIGRLLQNRQRFCVPIYQRHYVWTKQKQWEPFWNDVRTKAIECLAGRERRFSHFMGAVVLETRGGFSAGRVPTFQVVDGQQRLTTFQLFLAAARDYAIQSGFSGSAEKIRDYLLNDKPRLMVEPDIEVFKVWPTQYDRELFIDLMTQSRKELRAKYPNFFYVNRDRIYDYKWIPNLIGAYGYFFDRIRHAVETDDLDDEFAEDADDADDPLAERDRVASESKEREIKLDAIWQALVEEFKVVEIVLEDGDDAQVIFETLNERGEPLLATDLVRNNIFHRADAAGEKAEILFAKHWKPFEDPFWSLEEKQGRYKKPRIEFFLSNYIAGQIAGEVNLSKLFSEYKAFIKPKGVVRFAAVADEIQALASMSGVYRELVERSSGSALARFSARLLPWDVKTVYPLAMRLWASSEMSAQDKADCLDALISLIVRRSVCGLTTKNYNKFFLMVVARLNEVGWTKAALVNFLLEQKQESGRMPQDDEFYEKWCNAPVYRNLQPARTRAILEEVELHKRTTFHEVNQLAENLTVEHILPTNWRTSWPMPDGTQPTSDEFSSALFAVSEDETLRGQIARRIRLKDSIGNLTLLTQPLNSTVSNGPWAGKRQALEDHSLLVLNREVSKHETWDEKAITARSDALFKVALQVWALPASITS
ncbi:DUF262 domain-containing protein [Rhodocyclus tenuis]|uniref:DUF262 domain-containing protein n=1 Tax=Rhodocyclus gracilis TaxID=2929842 RepID=UPI001298DD0D|nr:DUF262 domain-containing protein [Rhodocyclus gracilis]MRD73135.1 DUF262 domain-containing protein [Rhodocyclus gracilis]